MFSLDFAFAHGRPQVSAHYKVSPEDFVVDEDLGFTPSGEGEHLFLRIQKRGENTQWVVEKLAAHFAIRPMDIGFCGMKDRHAVTTQWLSIYDPKQALRIDPTTLCQTLNIDMAVLAVSRHHKKLRRGQHRANHFSLTLRQISDLESLKLRLPKLAASGVPNYFGEQRFGRSGGNLVLADAWFVAGELIRKRSKRVLAMSAARAYLFNHVLSARVAQGNWQQILDGEPLASDISATGPMWGRGRGVVSGELLALEASLLVDFGLWREGLEHCGLKQERRALQLSLQALTWTVVDERSLRIDFGLPPGQYATSVLRELIVPPPVAV